MAVQQNVITFKNYYLKTISGEITFVYNNAMAARKLQ